MRYTYPPAKSGQSDTQEFINHGDYLYEMPGLRVWKKINPGYDDAKKTGH